MHVRFLYKYKISILIFNFQGNQKHEQKHLKHCLNQIDNFIQNVKTNNQRNECLRHLNGINS